MRHADHATRGTGQTGLFTETSVVRANIYWIPTDAVGRIGIMTRPRGGEWLDDEIRALRDAGTDVLVSLLEAHEVSELELESEESLCLRDGIDFISFPIPDRGIPVSRSAMADLIGGLRNSVLRGGGVAIHCRQGIGRSSMVAAIVLLSLGARPDGVFQLVSESRGCPVPDTGEQAQYALSF